MSRVALLAAVASAATAAVTTAGVLCGARPAGRPLVEPVEIAAAAAPTGPRPVELLRAWDTRRADAWAHGDTEQLAALYTRGSGAGRHDVAMLRAWTARGLVVRGMGVQLVEVRVLAHSPSRWTLEVTDRLVGGEAVGPGVRRPLPRDRATTRTVVLQHERGQWLVASVLPTP